MTENKDKLINRILNKSTILSYNEIDFDNFEIIKDDLDVSEELKTYVLKYKNNNKKYVCFNFNIKNFEIEEKGESVTLKIKYIGNETLFEFFEKFDEKVKYFDEEVQKIIEEKKNTLKRNMLDKKYNYKSFIEKDNEDNKYIKMNVSCPHTKSYNNANITIRAHKINIIPVYLNNYKGKPFWNIEPHVLKITEN